MKRLKILQRITDRSSDSLEAYFNEINQYPLITQKEERRLFQLIQNGDALAKEKIVLSNLRFVVSVAKQYPNSNIPLNDLVNEGNIGLIEATERFDLNREVKFISFAVWWIRNYILKAINEKFKMIRTPGNIYSLQLKVNRLKDLDRNEQNFYMGPNDEDLAKLCSVSLKEIQYLKTNALKPVLSFDKSLHEDSGSLLDILADPSIDALKTDAEDSRNIDVNRMLNKLPELERAVIVLSFGLGNHLQNQKLTEIGKMLGYSSEGIRMIKNRALKRLKKNVKNKSFLVEYS